MNPWLEKFMSSRPILVRVIRGLVKPDDIEDIMQETFLNSYTAARSQNIKNPQAFMAKIARNIALNHIGKAEARLCTSIEELINKELEPVSPLPTPEHQHQSDEEFRAFCNAVARMPVMCRKVFILKKVCNFSQKEIAAHLKISEKTVEQHVSRGLLLSATHMIEQGFLTDCKQVKKRTVGTGT